MTGQQYDETKLERIIRKIKRCLALSKSSNENEACYGYAPGPVAYALVPPHRNG